MDICSICIHNRVCKINIRNAILFQNEQLVLNKCEEFQPNVSTLVYKDILDGGKIKPIGGYSKQDCYNALYQLHFRGGSIDDSD